MQNSTDSTQRIQLNKRRSRANSTARAIFLLVLAVLCLAAVAAAWAFGSIPRQAEMEFGPVSPAISPLNRFVYSLRLLAVRQDLSTPAAVGMPAQKFDVELGEPVESIAFRLEAAGLIRNAEAFRLYLIYSGLDITIQAGQYQISSSQTPVEIGRFLQDSTPKVVPFNILAGWRLEEVAAALPTSGLRIQPGNFLELARSPAIILPEGWPELATLEGFLFPGTYEVDRETSTTDLLKMFLARFDENVDAELVDAFGRHNLSLEQAVTLASIVEREAVTEEEMALIASVFYNRIDMGMRLDSDPTVQYAVGFNAGQDTWWTNPLSQDDLAANSPYNTYRYTGLPPAPIASPSLAALQAVAYPAQTPYYYFRARCDGSGKHAFAETYEEHIQNACQ